MSYILDALKRADAERERGQVPGLHAHPLGEGSADARRGTPRWALWGGLAAGAVVLAALAWRMGADANAPVPAPVQPAPVQPAPAEPVVAAAPAKPVATPAPDVPSYAPPPVTATPRAPVKESRAPAPAASTPVVAAAPAPSRPAAPAPAPAPAANSKTPANPSAPIPLLAELPSSLRQQLPTLTIGGSVYSDDAASRFIMLNGEVVKEGSQPAPGLVVERIEPRSAVLRFKGERFRLPY
jgi:general secretion pathway protein B